MGSGPIEVTAPRAWALVAGIVGCAATALYIGVIVAQGGNSVLEIASWVVVMAGASACALLAALTTRSRVARRSLQIATAIFAIIGVLGILTIGLPFLVAAGCAGVGLAMTSRDGAPAGDPTDDGSTPLRLPEP